MANEMKTARTWQGQHKAQTLLTAGLAHEVGEEIYQSDNEELEKHHALPPAVRVEKDEDDEDVGGGDEHARPEG